MIGRYVYDFESGRHEWHISDEENKPTDLVVTDKDPQSGMYALRVTSPINGINDPLYQGIEAWFDFGRGDLTGAGKRGPINTTNMVASCWVKVSAGFEGTLIRVFVRDTSARNSWGVQHTITPSDINEWFQIQVRVANGFFDEGFDSTQTVALGVRVDNYDETRVLEAPIYVDSCSIS